MWGFNAVCNKNPIAEPYILGISSGASCGACFCYSFRWSIKCRNK
ncbi:iron chelate uptake ABC transporter family permease subunit [Paraclostridium bifermentans]|nr:iron chelate uptake ABC transporter family permease subunit [Paraclostridium bifermentans]